MTVLPIILNGSLILLGIGALIDMKFRPRLYNAAGIMAALLGIGVGAVGLTLPPKAATAPVHALRFLFILALIIYFLKLRKTKSSDIARD